MSDATPQIIETCPTCNQEIDVTDQEPFSNVLCPACGAGMRVRVHFNDYTLLESLGEGGMGAVFRATDDRLHREVALKILKRESADAPVDHAKLAEEARLTASINHPNVVRVFAFGEDHGQFYLAMELVNKGSLDELMELHKRVPEAQVLDIGIQIASGLQAAAERGLIHRDVKPGNILFANSRLAKIVDFGLARILSGASDDSEEIWGTPFYVAPEKLEHRPEDFRSDIYSLGATLFHAIAGQPPFDAETATETALMHLNSTGVDLQKVAPDVSDATAYVINRMLNRDPDKRFASYADLIEQLSYARQRLKEAEEAAKKPKPKKQSQFPVGLTLLAIGLFAVSGFGIYALIERNEAMARAASKVDLDLIETELREGRRALVQQRFDDAVESFGKAAQAARGGGLIEGEALAQRGIAELMLGRQEEAMRTFAELAAHPLYGMELREQPRARFLAELGRRMSDGRPVEPSEVAGLSASGIEALGLLAYGLRNWGSGNIDAGGEMLSRFREGSPTGQDAWVAELRPMVDQHVKDFARYRKLRAAGESDRSEKWVETVREFRDHARTGTGLKKGLDRLLAGNSGE